jgi:hypothetical protein
MQVGLTTLGNAQLGDVGREGIFFRDGLWVAATTTASGSSAPASALAVTLYTS